MEIKEHLSAISASENEKRVSAAFSRQSPMFNEIDDSNKIILWMREKFRNEILKNASAGSKMLELNCGTGIDALFFAKQGFNVLATDNADGMLDVLKRHMYELKLESNIKVQKCSFNNLETLAGVQVDYIYSNFGGLNCTDDLQSVLNNFHHLLKPGGYFTLCIMPGICPWEILMSFKGDFKTAFRRFKKNGTSAHLEGVYFNCYYYDPGYIIKAMGAAYKLYTLKGLASIMPPPFIENFKEKYPRLFSFLGKLEDKVSGHWPFNRWCDHYIITMQKK